MTTIGYGDFTPETNLGKIFTIFFVLAGIATAFYMISIITRHIYKLELKARGHDRAGIIKIRRAGR